MKLLKRRHGASVQTIEAYACSCNNCDYCGCICNCGISGSPMDRDRDDGILEVSVKYSNKDKYATAKKYSK